MAGETLSRPSLATLRSALQRMPDAVDVGSGVTPGSPPNRRRSGGDTMIVSFREGSETPQA